MVSGSWGAGGTRGAAEASGAAGFAAGDGDGDGDGDSPVATALAGARAPAGTSGMLAGSWIASEVFWAITRDRRELSVS